MKRFTKKQGYVFAAIAVIVALLAGIQAVHPFHLSVGTAQAQTESTASITFNGKGGQITLPSDGPFTEDIQAQICVTSSHAPGQFCATTPWASQAGNSTFLTWSPWVWPGYNNGLSNGSVTVSLNTRPLPAGTTLNNVRIGFGIAEANGGPSTINPSVSPASAPCEYGITPTGGGTSRTAYGYTYISGTGINGASCPATWQTDATIGSSGQPDDVQIGISASFGGVSLAGDLPSEMDSGATNTASTITVTNLASTLVPTSWTELATGPGRGTCDADPDANGVDTAAAGSLDAGGNPVTETCTISVDLTTNLELAHTGAFTTPSIIPYVITNVTKVSTVTPSYDEQGYYYVDSNGITNGTCVPGSEYENAGGGACSISVSGSSSVTYNGGPAPALGIPNGGTATFDINPLTAPSAAGTYSEKWRGIQLAVA